MPHFSHRWFSHIDAIDASLWQSFFASNPFTTHAFLSALEQSQCVAKTTGWQAQHLVVYEDDKVIALAPGYLKSHSYGEYVFDWAWADAYAQHGLSYYPKWLCGSPFSPIEGQRIAIKHPQSALLYHYITNLLTRTCQQFGWSGWHINFCPKAQAESLIAQHGMHRLGVQFHWFNRDYTDFDDFLDHLSSRRRKVIKKERRKISQQEISIEWLQGAQLTPQLMERFCLFYQRTYLKRSGHTGYLNAHFFHLLQSSMAEKMVLMLAMKDQQIIAATLSFVDENTLYGRYWGAIDEFNCLHFELCYYQGIEYCIRHQLHCFHAGAQGEHKIVRGFEPVLTHSVHAIMAPEFKHAIADYLERERQQVGIYYEQCQALLPFKD